MTCHCYISGVSYSIVNIYASVLEIDIVRLSVYSYNTPNSKSQIILARVHRKTFPFKSENERLSSPYMYRPNYSMSGSFFARYHHQPDNHKHHKRSIFPPRHILLTKERRLSNNIYFRVSNGSSAADPVGCLDFSGYSNGVYTPSRIGDLGTFQID
jgi:hypothetical protein